MERHTQTMLASKTCWQMGISTPILLPSATTLIAVFTPSATIRMLVVMDSKSCGATSGRCHARSSKERRLGTKSHQRRRKMAAAEKRKKPFRRFKRYDLLHIMKLSTVCRCTVRLDCEKITEFPTPTRRVFRLGLSPISS